MSGLLKRRSLDSAKGPWLTRIAIDDSSAYQRLFFLGFSIGSAVCGSHLEGARQGSSTVPGSEGAIRMPHVHREVTVRSSRAIFTCPVTAFIEH